MEFDISAAEKQVALIQSQIDAEKKRLSSMTPEQKLAEALHDAVCTWNHTDGCGWYYETWKMERGVNSEHARYLKKVRDLDDALRGYGLTVEQAIEVYKLVKRV
jgi:hypothetical protein